MPIMRLLKYPVGGTPQLYSFRKENEIPPYTILSHTWGAEEDEVVFDDIINRTGREKKGFKKIEFCATRTREDGFEHFWIDSCCINKGDGNSIELRHAISSMFKWYQRSEKCYVYLSDVSSLDEWEEAFQESRWFTRGWTLQELLAPTSVEFYSAQLDRLGDKYSLESYIHDVTKIPIEALRGRPLTEFAIDVRKAWTMGRTTQLPEDMVYSLLGIFDVTIPLSYGEGWVSASQRLQESIQQTVDCLKALQVADPRYDKDRLERQKGGLLADSWRWVLQNPNFKRWQSEAESRVLWIKGDPGKGKTMLLCGIIDELRISTPRPAQAHIAFCFCVATDAAMNSAPTILRRLIWILLFQQPSLISHVRGKYDYAGANMFSESNAWFLLRDIFIGILQDRELRPTYLIIDALDECSATDQDLPNLLDLIVETASISPRVKWVVSSRNYPNIEKKLRAIQHGLWLSLELNQDAVSAAITAYVQFKVDQLSYADQGTSESIRRILLSNAQGTFLWVALVCQELERFSEWEAITQCQEFPRGLESLYQCMLGPIVTSGSRSANLYRAILAITCIVQRPLTLNELAVYIDTGFGRYNGSEILLDVVKCYSSFLIVKGDTVSLVHQSAKEYLLEHAQHDVYPTGIRLAHYDLFQKSLQILMEKLEYNIYNLDALGKSINDIEQLEPIDRLSPARYACAYWIDHLRLCDPLRTARGDFNHGGSLHSFLRIKYLYWLEALSLCRSIPRGLVSIQYLEQLISKDSTIDQSVAALFADASRFLSLSMRGIQSSPLQAYVSALIHTPPQSLIRGHYQEHMPDWITIRPSPIDTWGQCVLTLEGHNDAVTHVSFSSDSTRLVTGSDDGTVKIWNPNDGQCLRTLYTGSTNVRSVMFSRDSAKIAAECCQSGRGPEGSNYDVLIPDNIKIWNVESGRCLQTMDNYVKDYELERIYLYAPVVFSYDLTQFATAPGTVIKIWNMADLTVRQLEARDTVKGLACSPDWTRLSSCSGGDQPVQVWTIDGGRCIRTIEIPRAGNPTGRSDFDKHAMSFSRQSNIMAILSASWEYHGILEIWEIERGDCLFRIETPYSLFRLAFDSSSTQVAAATRNFDIMIWNTENGEDPQVYRGHRYGITSIAFSHDSKQLASADFDSIVKIWDILRPDEELAEPNDFQLLEEHTAFVQAIVISHDSLLVASASTDNTIKIWHMSTGRHLKTLKGHYDEVIDVIFLNPQPERLASLSWDATVKIWEVDSGECLKTLEGHYRPSLSKMLQLSPRLIITATDDCAISIWDIDSGERVYTLQGHTRKVHDIILSACLTRLVSISEGDLRSTCALLVVKIWDMTTFQCLHTLQCTFDYQDYLFSSAISISNNLALIAVGTVMGKIKVWDIGHGVWSQAFEAYQDCVGLIVFSPDSSQLACASESKRGTSIVKILDVHSGHCHQTVDIGQMVHAMSFNSAGSELNIDGVIIPLSEISTSAHSTNEVLKPRSLGYRGTSIGHSDSWIRYGFQDLVWLPSEFRPKCSAVSGNWLVTGLGSGKILFYHIDGTRISSTIAGKSSAGEGGA